MPSSPVLNDSGIPAPLRAPLTELADRLSELFSERLLGLALYGGVLESMADHRAVPAQTVMVLERVELAPLRRLSQFAALLGRQGFAAPLAMTPEYISASLDTFPLELMEIQQLHVTVTGRDFFENLEVNAEHVRLQCERELKRILMRVRQGVLLAADHEHLIGQLVADIGLHIGRALRGMAWLDGIRDYASREQVVGHCAKMIDRPLAGVAQAMKVAAGHGWTDLEALYADIEALTNRANGE